MFKGKCTTFIVILHKDKQPQAGSITYIAQSACHAFWKSGLTLNKFIMKKCAEFIFYSLIIAFFTCCGTKSKENVNVSVEFSSFEIHDSCRLIEQASDSPVLNIDISLAVIETGNAETDENINRTIAYILFESPVVTEGKKTITDACEHYVKNLKKEYRELIPEYINIKESGVPEVWYNNYYLINSEASTGYKGYINYIIQWEEYTGGAHPMSNCTALNFNPENGEEIVLEEILKEGYEEQLISILEKNLAKQLNVEDINAVKDKGYMYGDAEMFVSNNFILEEEQIVFIYNKYDLAPYSAGEIMINVSYDEIKKLMK